MMERDGRPQGPTLPHPRRPRPYYTPILVARWIVGGKPICAYLNGIVHKGCHYIYAPPAAHWLRRKTTNSAGFTGPMPISMNNWPRSRTSCGLFSSSHLTKNASSGERPKSIPPLHAPVRKAQIGRAHV